MSKPETIPGFVRIADVKSEYFTSRKTVERRRDRARDTGDATVYRMFRLRTKDGEVLVDPTLDQVNTLTKEGRVPEWFVSRTWLDKQFGKRGEEPARHLAGQGRALETQEPSGSLVALREQYEARINDLKDQLVAAERREQKALEYAERDKQRFAAATHQLTQVLALPGLTEASKLQRQPSGFSGAPPPHHVKASATDGVPDMPAKSTSWLNKFLKRAV